MESGHTIMGGALFKSGARYRIYRLTEWALSVGQIFKIPCMYCASINPNTLELPIQSKLSQVSQTWVKTVQFSTYKILSW